MGSQNDVELKALSHVKWKWKEIVVHVDKRKSVVAHMTQMTEISLHLQIVIHNLQTAIRQLR